MNLHLVAFVMGLVSLSRADVSHLKHASSPSNSLSTDDQNYVSIKFSNAGNTANSNPRYWWLNTETSPFTKSHNHEQNQNNYNSLQAFAAAGSAHQTLETQNNLHESPKQNYILNPFLNVKSLLQQPQLQHNQNIYAHMATLSGSPSEVNNLMQDTTQTNHIIDVRHRQRQVPRVPCYGASQVCAPKDACEDGFISERNLGLVLSQSNVSHRLKLRSKNIWTIAIKQSIRSEDGH